MIQYKLNDKIKYQHKELLAIYFLFNNPDNINNIKIIVNNNKIIYNNTDLKVLTFVNFISYSNNLITEINNNKNIGMYSFSINPDSDNPHGSTNEEIEIEFEYNNNDKIEIIYQCK